MKSLLASLAFVLSVSLNAAPVWTKGVYADNEYVEVANRLNGNASNGYYDADTTTRPQLNSYTSFTYNYDTPVDLTDIRVYTSWDDDGRVGFSISNLMVRYVGGSDYVELPNTDIDYCSTGTRANTNRICGLLADDNGGYIASGVESLKINFGYNQYGYIFLGELEVAGTPYVAESLTADGYLAAGQLTAALSAVAHDYPVEIHFCSGATNGGDNPSDWESDVVVGTLASADAKLDYQSAVNYAYGRFYFASPAYSRAVWSDLVEASSNPYAVLIRAVPTSATAEFDLKLISPGLNDSTADVLFTYAPAGEALATTTTVRSAVAPGTKVTHNINGLTSVAAYDYAFVIVNSSGGKQILSGTFTTLSVGSWMVVPDITVDDFVFPKYHLNGQKLGLGFDGILDNVQAYADSYCKMSPTGPLQYKFSKPHDLKSVSLYMLFPGRAQIAFSDGLKVKYDGAADYTTIPLSALSAPVDTTWRTYLVKFTANDDFFATNVVEFVLTPTYVQSGYCVANEAVLEGVPSDHDQFYWEFGKYPNETYQARPDALDDFVATRTNMDSREYDNDIGTCYYSPNTGAADPFKDGVGRKTGHTYTWEFSKRVDLSGLEICSHGPRNAGRNELVIEGFYVKHRGDADFVRVSGTSLDRFDFATSNNYARLVSDVPGKRLPLRNVVAAKLVIGTPMYGHVGVFVGEVHPLGTVHNGFVIVVR